MTRIDVPYFSEKTSKEIQTLLRKDRQSPKYSVGDRTNQSVRQFEFGGYVAKTTSAITAATDAGAVRTVGSGTCTLYARNASTDELEVIPDLEDLDVYNSTVQEAADDVYIQVKLDVAGDLYWDVADCPA